MPYIISMYINNYVVTIGLDGLMGTLSPYWVYTYAIGVLRQWVGADCVESP